MGVDGATLGKTLPRNPPKQNPQTPSSSGLGGLEPWVSGPIYSWNSVHARHLLRRAAFAPTTAEVSSALALTPNAVVDSMLAPRPAPTPPSWVTQLPYLPPLTSAQQTNYNNWIRELREWWIRLMLTQPTSLTEKMVLFWHGHFANQYSTVQVPQYMYKQNALFRQHAIGNFKELVRQVTVDPAMLIYLDGVRNRVGSPNENYAREVLELFTIGIGNYTQVDIQNAARALTGWTVNGLNPVFVASRHDNGVKTFMGQSGNFDSYDIIDIVFQQPATATFICRKLYKYFVYEVPDETVVNQMATIFRNNNYEIAPVLATLFKSAHFFSPLSFSAEITSPIEKMVGAVRQLNIAVNPSSAVVPSFIRSSMANVGQNLLEPPNVAGWPGYRQWISTTTLLQRNVFTDAIVTGRDINNVNIGFKVSALPFALLFPNPNDAVALVNDIATHLVALPLSASRRQVLLDTLLEGIELYDWSVLAPSAASRIEGLLKVVFRMAEVQLG